MLAKRERLLDFRFGSQAEVGIYQTHVRSNPKANLVAFATVVSFGPITDIW
jgi:hypothetical protein